MYADVEVALDASISGVSYAKVELSGTAAFNFDVRVTPTSGTRTYPERRYSFYPYSSDSSSKRHAHMTSFRFVVLGVPISVDFGLQLSAGISGSVSGTVKGHGPAVSAYRTITMGAEYRSGSWRTLNGGSMSLSTRAPALDLSGRATVIANVQLSMQANMYGVWPLRAIIIPTAEAYLGVGYSTGSQQCSGF